MHLPPDLKVFLAECIERGCVVTAEREPLRYDIAVQHGPNPESRMVFDVTRDPFYVALDLAEWTANCHLYEDENRQVQ